MTGGLGPSLDKKKNVSCPPVDPKTPTSWKVRKRFFLADLVFSSHMYDIDYRNTRLIL